MEAVCTSVALQIPLILISWLDEILPILILLLECLYTLLPVHPLVQIFLLLILLLECLYTLLPWCLHPSSVQIFQTLLPSSPIPSPATSTQLLLTTMSFWGPFCSLLHCKHRDCYSYKKVRTLAVGCFLHPTTQNSIAGYSSRAKSTLLDRHQAGSSSFELKNGNADAAVIDSGRRGSARLLPDLANTLRLSRTFGSNNAPCLGAHHF